MNTPSSQSLTGKAAKGLAWSTLATGANIVGQFVLTIILARLLRPADFGLVAEGILVLRVGQMIVVAGLSSALVQLPKLSNENIRATFVLAIIAGLALSAGMACSAPWLASLVGSGAAQAVVRVLSLALLASCASVVPLAVLRRLMRFKALAIIDTAGLVVGYGATAVILAVAHAGALSLAWALVTQSLLTALLAFLFAPHEGVGGLNLRQSWRVARLGLRYSGSALLEFAGYNVDNLVVARVLGARSLGLYTKAVSLSSLPAQLLNTSVSKVLFPSYSLARGDGSRLNRGYRLGLTLSSLLTTPVSLGVIPAAHVLVLVLLGPAWLQAVPALQILALSVPLNLICVPPIAVLDAAARVRDKAVIQAVFLAVTTVAVAFAGRYGIAAVATAAVMGQALRLLLLLLVAEVTAPLRLKGVWHALLPGLITAALAVGLIAVVVISTSALSPIISLALATLAGLLAYVIVLAFPPQSMRADLMLLLELVKSKEEGSPRGRNIASRYARYLNRRVPESAI